jgi:hypothetical protein
MMVAPIVARQHIVLRIKEVEAGRYPANQVQLIRDHIIRRAIQLKAEDLLPPAWREEVDDHKRTMYAFKCLIEAVRDRSPINFRGVTVPRWIQGMLVETLKEDMNSGK